MSGLHSCNPSTPKGEVRESGIKSQAPLQSYLSPDYVS